MAHTSFSSEDTAPEKGTIGIEVTFEDEEGNALTPDSLTWTLTDKPPRGDAATIINSREDVAVTNPASVETIILSGNDLTFLEGEDEEVLSERVLTLEYTYSSNLGNNLPGKAQYVFSLERLYVFED